MAPVLYASQWFLTLFSCPFPAAFSCRIIDTVLAEGHSEILQQARLLHCSSHEPGNHCLRDVLVERHCDALSMSPDPTQVALAVCAECEVALLQLHDFEELITYLKVSIMVQNRL